MLVSEDDIGEVAASGGDDGLELEAVEGPEDAPRDGDAGLPPRPPREEGPMVVAEWYCTEYGGLLRICGRQDLEISGACICESLP